MLIAARVVAGGIGRKVLAAGVLWLPVTLAVALAAMLVLGRFARA